jgi:hypothetical protein
VTRNASWSEDPRPLDGGPPAPLVADEATAAGVRAETRVAIEDARWGHGDRADLPDLRAIFAEWSGW